MEKSNIYNLLDENAYPGRGIVAGLTPDGKRAAIAYFIMGRSANSRNRVFESDGNGIRTTAADPGKLTDPSLIIYSPVRVSGNNTIVTNGDQTDTIYDFVEGGRGFAEALETRTFEPDEPNWTPRISAMLTVEGGELRYLISILKSADGNGGSVRRYTFAYPQPMAGEGHFIHTYRFDGTPIPSFEGEPVRVAVPVDIDEFADELWKNLNDDNKVSLFVRYIDLATGAAQDRIINKYNRV